MSKIMVDRCGDIQQAFRWEHEKQLLDIVRSGSVERINDVLPKAADAYDQTVKEVYLSSDEKENEFIRFVSAVVLFSRTAIEAGVPEIVSYAMAESYIYCARKIPESLFKDALFSFTEIVAECKIKNDSALPVISEIKTWIMKNLNNPIRLKDISEIVSLSPSRISHLFRDETGMTIHQYIEQERIRAACASLAYSNLEIAGISEYLCFSSPAHFSTVFKKRIGITPLMFRKQFAGRSKSEIMTMLDQTWDQNAARVEGEKRTKYYD